MSTLILEFEMHKWIKHIIYFLIIIFIPLKSIGQNNNLSSLSIDIEFKAPPTSVNIEYAPLKYNKKFALSYTLDDGLKDAYTHAFKFITGGTVEGVDYDPLYFTDGCGNDINFKMSAAILSFSNDESVDLHDPDGSYASLSLTWDEIIEMYQDGWGILNHGLTSSTSIDKDYSIGRNRSYIKLKTQTATSGGIYTNVFVNPNGDDSFTSPAFSQGYNAAYRQWSYGVPYLNVYSTSSITDLESLKMGRKELSGATSLATIADELYSASNSISNNRPWASTFNHSVSGGAGYTFSTFKNYMLHIADTYGKNGNDSIWFTTEEEVLDYLLNRDAITINQQTTGNTIRLTFSGTTPTDLRNYALSLIVSSNATDTITAITIDGETFSSHSTLNQTQALINAEWDGSDFPTATETASLYVDSAESIKTQYIANIAMDYVSMLDNGSIKTDLKSRLCGISGISLPESFCSTCSTSIGNDTTICVGECVELSVPAETSYLWSTGETTRSITACPTNTTEYSIKVLNDVGCEARDTIIVTVKPIPEIQTSGNTSICPEQCVKIWANGGTEYLWSTGETTDTIEVCPSVLTKYYVTVTNDLGCEALDSIIVGINSVPVANAGNDINVNYGDCVTLSATGGDHYKWSTDETTSSIEVCPTSTSLYTVTAYSDQNCADTDSVLAIVRAAQTTSTKDIAINSIVVTFESAPTGLSVNKASLKYNKDFALSYHIEDGSKDVFTHALPYLNGGVIDNTTYPGIYFTDGCGNDIPFKMSTSLFSFNDAQNTDLHDPAGANTATHLTWTEITQLYQAGWGIYNQGLTSSNTGNQDYLIGRNHSYIKLNTQDATTNGIDPKIFVNPQGDISFSSPAFDQGYIAAFRPYTYGVDYLDVSIPNTITDIDSLKMGRTNLINPVSLAKLADSLNANSDAYTKQWSSAYNKSITGATGGYSFTIFKFYMDYIATQYGKSGADNIWMTSEEEVLEYMTLNKLIGVNTEILGNQLLITFTGDLPSDFRHYALSLVIENDKNITDITINGEGTHTSTGVGQSEALINLNWDEKVVVSKADNAVKHVNIAKASQSQNDILIAVDYVNMMESGQAMLDLRDSLCNIPGAVLPDGWCDCSFSLGSDTVICLGESIIIEAPLGVKYEWSTGDTTRTINVSPTIHTNYSVTVYNDQGCYSSDDITVIISPSNFATLIATDDSICANSCVDIVVSSSGASSYLWNTGATVPLINVCPEETTDYISTVTNVFGCTDTDTITIYTYPEPNIGISEDTSICKGECVELTASGGYEYLWSTGATTNKIEVCPEATTTYYVTVTNNNDCSSTDSVTVTVIGLPSISINAETDICLNECVELTAEGGDLFLWSTGQTSKTIEVCPEDTTTYVVNVYSDAGCSSKDSVTINVLPTPIATVSNDTSVCPNTCVKIFASGGTTYLWSTGATTDTIEICPSVPTKYYVSVYNENGCSVKDSIQINHLPQTNASAGEDQTICPGGEATLLATGGYSYLWNTGQETNSIKVSPEVSTEYFVTVTTADACPANDTVEVFVLTPPTANAGEDQTICPDECITLEASGGYEYLWDNGTESAFNEVCPTTTTNYVVTVYDEFGCSANDTVEIFIAETPSISFSGLSSVYCDNNSASLLEGSPNGGIFEGNGISNNIFYPAIAGVGTHEITYRIENDNGCWSKATHNTTVYGSPSIFLGNDTTICTNASLMLSVPSGFDSYLWSTGAINNSIILNGAGLGSTSQTVQLIATQNGCVAIDEINVSYISCTVGIDDLRKEGIYMYPNPTKGQFNIKFNTQEKDMRVDIINLQGQIIFSEELIDCNQSNCVKSIDLSTYMKGIYIVRFSNNNFIKTAKLLIN